jgi:hypothetical protein
MIDSNEIPPFEIKRPDGGVLHENHHLEFRPEKNNYRMKVTLDLDGGRFVGKRVVIPLHTSDLGTARQIRDGIMVALSKAGILSRRIIISGSDAEPGGDNSSACE